jgi:hypothetical protein
MGMTGIGFPILIPLNSAPAQAQSARSYGPGHVWQDAGKSSVSAARFAAKGTRFSKRRAPTGAKKTNPENFL